MSSLTHAEIATKAELLGEKETGSGSLAAVEAANDGVKEEEAKSNKEFLKKEQEISAELLNSDAEAFERDSELNKGNQTSHEGDTGNTVKMGDTSTQAIVTNKTGMEAETETETENNNTDNNLLITSKTFTEKELDSLADTLLESNDKITVKGNEIIKKDYFMDNFRTKDALKVAMNNSEADRYIRPNDVASCNANPQDLAEQRAILSVNAKTIQDLFRAKIRSRQPRDGSEKVVSPESGTPEVTSENNNIPMAEPVNDNSSAPMANSAEIPIATLVNDNSSAPMAEPADSIQLTGPDNTYNHETGRNSNDNEPLTTRQESVTSNQANSNNTTNGTIGQLSDKATTMIINKDSASASAPAGPGPSPE